MTLKTKEICTMTGSSSIDALSYDSKNRELGIKFASGGEYVFAGVPKKLWTQMKTTRGSLGRFFHKNIKGEFESNKI